MAFGSKQLSFSLMILLIAAATSLEVIKYEGNAKEIYTAELPVHFLVNSTVSFKNITFPIKALEAIAVSASQIRDGKVEVSNNGAETMVIADGRRITLKKGVFKSMEDMKEDPVLKPQKLPSLNWIRAEECKYGNVYATNAPATIKISVNATSISVYYDGKQMLLEGSGEVFGDPNGIGYFSEEEGLILMSINLRSCQVTYKGIFAMNQFGIFRNLNKRLMDIAPGSLVVLISLFDGSRLLNESSRELMKSFGSSWADDFLYRDGWVFVFMKGGKILADVLIANLGFTNTTSSPFEVLFKVNHADFGAEECSLWPDTEEWNARRIFCYNYDGLGKLCDCDNPLYITPSSGTKFDPDVDIPVTILCGGRTYLLIRLLETLMVQKGLTRDLIIIAMDGYHENIVRVAYLLGIKVLYHRIEGTGGVRISRLLRFSLFNLIQKFPEAKYFAQLDDDFVLSKDFYSFMQQVSPIFSMDVTIWCASGFNIFSFPHTSSDPEMVYRGSNVPYHGWMMPKNIIIELLEQWLPSQIPHDWDFFFALPKINKGRECIVPEVIRVNHPTGGGTHFGPSLFMERNFASRKLNENLNVKIPNLDRLVKSNYIRYITEMSARSTIVEISDIKDLKIDSEQKQTYTIYIDKNSTNFQSTSRVIHNAFESWDSVQFNIWEAVTYHYYNATIIIISVPSPYSLHLPEDYKFFTATSEDLAALVKDETDLSAAMLTPRTHRTESRFPIQNMIWQNRNFIKPK